MGQNTRVFVLGRPLQLSLHGSSLTCKQKTGPERLARGNHSSLFCPFVNYKQKVYITDPWPLHKSFWKWKYLNIQKELSHFVSLTFSQLAISSTTKEGENIPHPPPIDMDACLSWKGVVSWNSKLTNCPTSCPSMIVRVTRLGEISQFGLLFKGPGNFWRGNMVCCRYFKSLERVWWRSFRLSNWAWWRYFGLIWFSNCFGFYFQKLGDFFQSSGHPDDNSHSVLTSHKNKYSMVCV